MKKIVILSCLLGMSTQSIFSCDDSQRYSLISEGKTTEEQSVLPQEPFSTRLGKQEDMVSHSAFMAAMNRKTQEEKCAYALAIVHKITGKIYTTNWSVIRAKDERSFQALKTILEKDLVTEEYITDVLNAIAEGDITNQFRIDQLMAIPAVQRLVPKHARMTRVQKILDAACPDGLLIWQALEMGDKKVFAAVKQILEEDLWPEEDGAAYHVAIALQNGFLRDPDMSEYFSKQESILKELAKQQNKTE